MPLLTLFPVFCFLFLIPLLPLLQHTNDSTFQISDGTASNAEAEANAVFVDPFDGCDLSTVDEDSLENLKTMREVGCPSHWYDWHRMET